MTELAPGNLLPYFLIMLTALASARLLAPWMPPPLPGVPNGMLDALRGYLAVGVFICHALIWHWHLRDGTWQDSPSRFYTQIGQGGVVLFFMITGFLFYGKILDSRERPIDWSRLFISRVFRLTPAYLLAVFLLFVAVAAISDFQVRDDLGTLLYNAWRWLSFTIRGDPDLNQVMHTKRLVAGVTWTLVYEWYFYATLPLLALLTGRRAPILLVIFAIVIWPVFGWPWIGLLSFLGGMAAALARKTVVQRWVEHLPQLASAIGLGAMIAAVSLFPTSFAVLPNLLFTLAFIPIALGSNLFGLLNLRSAEILGTISYSMYLLHGLLLVGFFYLVVGRERGASLTLGEHWLHVWALTPVLVAVCVLSYRYIERPAIDAVPAAMRWWRQRLGAKRAHQLQL